MRVALGLIADGSLRIEPLITHRFPVEAATVAYTGLLEAPEAHLGVVLDWRSGQLNPL
jgi:threonine dehydrogenase-like Zn-dependent dehydrogenase